MSRISALRGPWSTLAGLALTVAGAAAWAQVADFARPEVSYTATRILETDQGNFTQDYSYAPGKARTEMNMGGQTMVHILREDLGVSWMVVGPGLYIESSLDELEALGRQGGSSPDAMEVVDHERIGEERIGGHDTVKHRVVARDGAGHQVTGHYWVTAEQIPVRMEMTVETERGTMDMLVRHEDLEIGPLPDSRFKVPAGYRKIDASGLPGMPGYDGG